jgi:uncharacterized membrane protein HdeD (DUF308 family)
MGPHAQESGLTPSVQSELFQGRGWIIILRGVTAVAFGILAVAGPGVTVTKLVILFGLYALVHGILTIAAAFGGWGQHGCGLLATEGIIGILAGIMTFQSRFPSPKTLVLVIWLWAIATGVLRLAEAIRLRKEISGDIWLMLSGLVPVLFGAMLILRPIIGAVGLALMIAIAALLWGACEILLGCELRGIRQRGQLGGA